MEEKFELLRRAIWTPNLGFFVVFRIINGELKLFRVLTPESQKDDYYKELGALLLKIAKVGYARNSTLVLHPEQLTRWNVDVKKGLPWWLIVIADGPTRVSGYIIVAKYKYEKVEHLNSMIRTIQNIMG